MCSDMQNTFLQLKETLNRRVEVQIWPLIWLMTIATVIIVIVGVIQMVSDFRREMYVRRWERENIIQPLQIRAREEEEEEAKKNLGEIPQAQGAEEQQKKKCSIS
ncbi:hypothetical protein EGW08_010243 [Elysia chlorotica]|uniref:Uncharacterized protein n=1 Tax=Elysia chlorotica TaxID=188477 RepID=A0A3S1C3I3_ELYCH|nr:hypothetical protein EGW08_010243 [Elysia chlorotica]